MNIVLMADARKNDLLINFCIAYKQILKKHTLISLFGSSPMIQAATQLPITRLTTEIHASIDQLASRVRYNEIDAVIYLRDMEGPLAAEGENPLFTACDLHNIPYASNLATAEILILGIDHGDLEWRELLR